MYTIFQRLYNSILLAYTTFKRMFKNFVYSTYTFFPKNLHNYVYLMYTILQWIYQILCIQYTQFFIECT